MTPAFDHLVIEVVALAGALADAGEHRHAAVRLGDVVDQLHDGHGLADAGAAEQADLAALGVGREQVDDLDAGDQDLRFGRLLDELRRAAMDRQGLLVADRAALVDRLADDVQDAAERLGADRHRRSGCRCRPPSRRAPGRRWCPWRWCGPRIRPDAGRPRARSGGRRPSTCRAFRMFGRSASKRTSTTAPVIWVIVPMLLVAMTDPFPSIAVSARPRRPRRPR